MTKIAVDLDNTLYNFEAAARDAFLELGETSGDHSIFRAGYNPWTEWRTMSDSCGPDIQERVIQMVHTPDSILNQIPFDGANETLWELNDAGYELLYISNREPDTQRATQHWLNTYGFPAGDLVCTRDSKLPFITDCQYLIDDRTRTIVQFLFDFQWKNKYGSENEKMARKVFSLAWPYNQNLTDVPGVYLAPTWRGIRFYLTQKGVLDAPAAVSA